MNPCPRQRWLAAWAVAVWLLAAAPALADALDDIRQADLKKNLGDYTSAMQLYNRAIRAGTLSKIKLSGALFKRAVVFGIIGDSEAMLADMAKAVKLNPDNTYFRLGYGSALYNAGQVDPALAQYRAAADLEPDNALPISALGVVQWDQGQYQEAEKLLQKAAALKPDSAWEQDKLGSFYLSLGRFAEAEKAFAKALSLEPQSAELPLLLYLARAHQGKGNREVIKTAAGRLKAGQWPEPVYRLFLGRSNPAGLLGWLSKSAGNPDGGPQAGGRFFLAHYYMLHKNPQAAIKLLDWLANHAGATSLSRPAARAELRRRGLLK